MRVKWEYGEQPIVDKPLGALPVIAEFTRRLDLAQIIDRLCPVRDVALATHGQVIEALVANRLTGPAAIWKVDDWARAWAVPETFGIDPDVLNDDRIARALDAVAPELERITGTIAARAISVFGIDVSRLHWDMTSISLFGAYPDAEDGYAQPRWGHPKDRRPDLKQIQAGLAVTADGGVPVLPRVYDGGAGEISQVVPAMKACKKIAGRKKFLLVGDSKLLSYTNVADMIAAGVTFIGPASKRQVTATELAACDLEQATEADYVADRDTGKPPERRCRYHLIADTFTLTPGRDRKHLPPITLRRIFVHSSARAAAAATNRTKKLDRARDDLGRLERGLGTRWYPDPQAVTERANTIARTRRVTPFLRWETGTDPDTGKPTVHWWFDQTALEAEAAADGWYALLTNLPATGAHAVEATGVLHRYKGQQIVERRYSDVKGPLAVAPLFLKTNRRIHALITVICLALLVYCLIERQARQAIAPADKMDGLYPNGPARPTGRLILQHLATLRLTPATATSPAIIPRPRPVQQRLLDLLGIDPARPP